ncbi:MAG: nucleoside-diphosphate kinase [Hoeflea sp.]|uniref:nucleoside-diphosphate kinase n=1 Tax=Hoeflea sp. TaxID=1940281 RepID=UPI001DCCC898|nr:nucleoside-diphosphate kinase [Hoeflea sp.]MBU4527292.1 nucleoside-diphosphate kinase [Alphaproteobacteria bacterium]MBU4546925.1 nucleoside-diphosphate kinase [Alphaproteobacteria bacterium]MBU4551563.1 nucleoside-diphosphate kinase [Alphaproteobacteria bacterium]MBV1725568.1 nucleoside-diphosphate kinase [Hoeflea sp.]MBV1759616.1 nucleoside-diphosphate kinase [Hoeflea sp.]
MWKNQTCTLTSKDFAILETMYDRRQTLADPVRQILKHKLDIAVVVFCEDIDASLVTLNTRLRYRISDTPSQSAIITQRPMEGMVGQCLSLQTVRGLACLGLSEAASISLPRQDSAVPDRLVIEAILFQPEAARRDRLNQDLARRSLRLVHSADVDIDPPPDRFRK